MLDAIYEQELKEGIHPGDEFRRYSVSEAENDSNFSKIKEQIAAFSEQLNRMDPVCDIQVPGNLNSNSKALEWILNYFNISSDVLLPISRQNFGTCYISKDSVKNGVRYCKTNEERAALAAIPKVIKKGIVIGEHSDHKGREKQTITFGTAVVLNGTRGNMGVVVNKYKNRYYAHRIVLPDGSAFEFQEKNTVPEGGWGVTNNGSLANRTATVSTPIISNASPDVNPTTENVTQMQQKRNYRRRRVLNRQNRKGLAHKQ